MRSHKLFLAIGPLLFLISCWMMSRFENPKAIYSCGVITWMLVWWLSEVVPMAITALIPILLFTAGGVMGLEDCLTSYSDRYVFLFLGGFILALAIEKWELHHFFAQWILSKTGNDAKGILGGFMLSTYFISMWISNTATAIMMIPMAMALTDSKTHTIPSSIKRSLVLGIAYSASIGGMATLLGSPPNAAMAGILSKDFNISVSFWDWFKWGFPFSIILLTIGYGVLLFFIPKIDLKGITIQSMTISNSLDRNQKKVLIIFITTATLWICQNWISSIIGGWFSDTLISLGMAFPLFISWKNKPLLQWEETQKLPWGILLMFGGGLCLANGFKASGMLDVISQAFSQHQTVSFTFCVLLCLTSLGLTALMSNLAMVALFIPIVGSLALQLSISPILLAIPVTLASSCDFMFPMSTPPNAIAYSSGHVSAKQMFGIGVVFNIIALILLVIWMRAMV